MVSNGQSDERINRIYHGKIAPIAEAFGHGIADALQKVLEMGNITIIGTRVKDVDVYPNDYLLAATAALSSRGYQVATHHLVINGQGHPLDAIPEGLIKDTPTMIVDVHLSRVFRDYMRDLKTRGASRAFYSYPVANLWEYTANGEIIQHAGV